MQMPDIYMLILISVGFVRGRDLQRFILSQTFALKDQFFGTARLLLQHSFTS